MVVDYAQTRYLKHRNRMTRGRILALCRELLLIFFAPTLSWIGPGDEEAVMARPGRVTQVGRVLNGEMAAAGGGDKAGNDQRHTL